MKNGANYDLFKQLFVGELEGKPEYLILQFLRKNHHEYDNFIHKMIKIEKMSFSLMIQLYLIAIEMGLLVVRISLS